MRHNIELPNEVVLDRFETASGREIPNYQDHSIMDFGDVNARRKWYEAQYPSAVARTTEPTGVYNCHGFVFASGRTGIDYGRDVRMILEDDGYVKISPADTLPGDVVLYVGPDGEVDHSALLVQLASPPRSLFAIVVSKWGNFTEYMHELHQCPYNSSNIEYWRIKKKPKQDRLGRIACLIQL
jgi:hypothetical protein